MPLIELARDPYYCIYFDSDESWLHVDWMGYQADTESVMHGSERMLALMVEHKAFRILNDNTHITGIWNVSSTWVVEDWFPRMREAGLQLFAWVYSPSRSSQIAANAILSHMDTDVLDTRIFYDVEEARKWLRRWPPRWTDAASSRPGRK